jgi:hypothetical protein
MVTLASVLEGCRSQTQGDTDKVLSYLTKKYPDQSFVVNAYRGAGLPGTTSEIEMRCSPADNPDIVFYVGVATAGGMIHDTYPSEYINYQLNKLAEERLVSLGIPARTYFYVSKLSDAFSEDMLIEDIDTYFKQTGANILFGTVLVGDRNLDDPEAFGTAIKTVFELLYEKTSVDIGADVYVVSSDALLAALEDMDKMTTQYAGSHKFAANEYTCAFTYRYLDGEGNYSASEMTQMLKEGYSDE